MLRELRIQNFAIIDRLEVQFFGRLNVLTGETGSGKSIVVDAIDLLLGGRAQAEQIRTGAEEAVLEAAFEVPPQSPVAAGLTEMDLQGDDDGILIIRRILNRSGKSRAYINGRLVTLGQLQPLGDLMVDIHGQHEHQSLLKTDQQLYLLDAFGKLPERVREYHDRYVAFRKLEDDLGRLQGTDRDRAQREDLLRFQSQEIEAAELSPGEDVRLEQERAVLANAGRLSSLTDEAYQRLYAADDAILSRLASVASSVEDLARTDERMVDLAESCGGGLAELREVADRLRDYRDRIEHNPERLGEIEDRIHLIQSLKKKYGPTLEEILEKHRTIREDLNAISTYDDRLKEVRDQVEKERDASVKLAKGLTKERTRSARLLERKVRGELSLLKMAKTRFEIRLQTSHAPGDLGSTGGDRIEFLVAPNPGEEPRPLARIASGGELSRIMLSLKSILAGVDRIPTLIFDEVDAGTGGAVAEEIGRRLRDLAEYRQVLCITHLPQIASQASTHFTIEKVTSNGRLVTRVKRLEKDGRVEEIARMLGGREMTQTAVRHAREMLNLGTQ